MYISGLPPQTTPGAAIRDGLRHYQPGERLDAVALTASRERTALLAVNGVPLRARIDRAVSEGQHLRLQVIQPGDPLTVRILEAGTPDAVLASALRRLLPAQSGWGPLLANLAWLSQPAAQATLASLPQSVREALLHLWRALPKARHVGHADGLQQAVHQSGLLLERQLTSGRPWPSGDLKGALLRLQHTLLALVGKDRSGTPAATKTPLPEAGRPLPQGRSQASLGGLSVDRVIGELAQQAEAVLARLGLHQLLAISGGSAGIPLLELPLRHAGGVDVLHLAIEPEEQNAAAAPAERAWTVTLALDLPELGPLQVRARLQGERLDTTFWAARPATQDRVTHALDGLRDRLHAAGLQVGQLDCLPGPPPDEGTRKGRYVGLIREQV